MLLIFPHFWAQLVFGRQCNWGNPQVYITAYSEPILSSNMYCMDQTVNESVQNIWPLLRISLRELHWCDRMKSTDPLALLKFRSTLQLLLRKVNAYLFPDQYRPYFSTQTNVYSSITITFTPKLRAEKIFWVYDLQWHWNRIYINIWKIFFGQLFIFVNNQTIPQTIDQSLQAFIFNCK